MGGDEEFDDATGDELYSISPSKKANLLMEKIEDDPSDMVNRLEMVAFIAIKIPRRTFQVPRRLSVRLIKYNAAVANATSRIALHERNSFKKLPTIFIMLIIQSIVRNYSK